jgi:tyrosinase
MAGPVRVRRDIWSLEEEQEWHPITRAYKLAVAELQSRPAEDPTSWVYQAQVHGMPDFGQPDQFRGQCQHFCWFFLPWHRLYLLWFEQIARAAIAAHPDIDAAVKASWALPYWNYSPGGQRATLPPSFREQEDPDDPNQANPLFVGNRNDYVNDGEPIDELATDALTALGAPLFSVAAPIGGFGGAATGFNHLDQDANRFPGTLERTPHGSIHNEVGGDMAGFDTAALDPVFWMHHANIDRLWEVWLGQNDRENPDATGSWGTTESHFHNPAGGAETGRAADVLDTKKLEYEYEDTSLPAPPDLMARRRVPSEPPPDHPAELVGATEDALELTGGTKRVALTIGAATGPTRGRPSEPERVYLVVEGIEGDAPMSATYAVFVDLPDDADPDEDPERHYAGTLSFFGIEQSRRVDKDPGGHGLAHSFDITTLVSDLRDAGDWDPDEVSVSFVPLRRGTRRRRGSSEGEGEGPPVTIGRVGIYVQ